MKRLKFSAIMAVAAAVATAVGVTACVQEATQVGLTTRPTGNFGLFYMDEGPSVKLAYGAPNSDDVAFMMQCAKGSHVLEISITSHQDVDPTLTVGAAGRVVALSGVVLGGDGPSILTARARSDIAPLKAFRRLGRIAVGYDGTKYEVSAKPGETLGVDRFFKACDHAI
jgi:hypothetical protein